MAGSPEQMPSAPNVIEDNAPKPKGVIPKNVQSVVIIGVAVLMILIMWLTGGGKKALPPAAVNPPPPPITPTDGAKVQEFRQTIQTEQQAARRAVPAPDSPPSGESMAMTGERILDRFLNILPTVTIREGIRLNVYLSNDLLLPDYNQHTMQSDL